MKKEITGPDWSRSDTIRMLILILLIAAAGMFAQTGTAAAASMRVEFYEKSGVVRFDNGATRMYRIRYPQDGGTMTMNAYCAHPHLGIGKYGAYQAVTPDPGLSKALYYGYNGPGWEEGLYVWLGRYGAHGTFNGSAVRSNAALAWGFTHHVIGYLKSGSAALYSKSRALSPDWQNAVIAGANWVKGQMLPAFGRTQIELMSGGRKVTTLEASWKDGVFATPTAKFVGNRKTVVDIPVRDGWTIHYYSGDVKCEETGRGGSTVARLYTDRTFWFTMPEDAENQNWSTVVKAEHRGFDPYEVLVNQNGVQNFVFYAQSSPGQAALKLVVPKAPVRELKLRILKRDAEDSSKKLSGAVFEVLDDTGTDPGAFDEKDQPVKGSDGKPVRLTTDADGKAETSSALPVGTYYIREIAAPEGYVKDEAPRKIILDGESAGDENGVLVQEVTVGNRAVPVIGTKACDAATGSHAGSYGAAQRILDTVRYEHLVPGKTYTLTAEIRVRETGEALLLNGKPVVVTKSFVPKAASGEEIVEAVLDTRALAGSTIVFFETLRENGKTIAVHADIGDEDQSIRYPQIRTRAHVTGASEKNAPPAKNTKLTDEVLYDGLPAGTYRLETRLVDASDGSAAPANGEEYLPGDRAVRDIVVKERAGTVSVNVTIDTKKCANKKLVFCEYLYEKKSGALVASHADLENTAQTIRIRPEKPNRPAPKTGDPTDPVRGAAGVLAGSGALAAVWILRRKRSA